MNLVADWGAGREASWPDLDGVDAEVAMKGLRVVSGVCVLFVTLGYGHLLAHHFMHSTAAERGAAFWGIFLTTAAAGIFAVVGGVLLLMQPKE